MPVGISATSSVDPALLEEWTQSVRQADQLCIERLLRSTPDLLWTPLTIEKPQHVIVQLKMTQSLGTSLDPLSALLYMLLRYSEAGSDAQVSRVLSLLLEVGGSNVNLSVNGY